MNDPRKQFVDELSNRRRNERRGMPLNDRLLLEADDERVFMDEQIRALRVEADTWRGIAEDFYNATQEIDYSVMMRVVKRFENYADACDV